MRRLKIIQIKISFLFFRKKHLKASKQTILNEAVTILRLLVKMYTFGKTSITCLPDIHKFSSLDENKSNTTSFMNLV